MGVLTGMRPGPYLVRVTGWGREATARALKELFETYEDIDDPSFRAAMDALEGQEHYLLRFWPAT